MSRGTVGQLFNGISASGKEARTSAGLGPARDRRDAGRQP